MVLSELKSSGKEADAEEVKEILESVTELTEAGQLFTEDIYEDYIDEVKQRKTVVKALCLHIAHDCNLACLLFCRGGGVSRKTCADVL